MSANRLLFTNGVLSSSSDVPPAPTFLESHPGAYTTTRTHNNGSALLFWPRHLRRIANSAKTLIRERPNLLFDSGNRMDSILFQFAELGSWESMIGSLVDDSMKKVLPVALEEMGVGEELAITTLLSGNREKMSGIKEVDEENFCEVFDVFMHVGMYVPPVFGVTGNGARLAVVGRGRDVANAKYSDWVRVRKNLEKFRPPSVTELLLSNDGDRILEGCLSNLFVVCRKESKDLPCSCINDGGKDNHSFSTHPIEIQTAPIRDGVLPGVLRQAIIDMCSKNSIPLREVSPSWSERETWEEAFITNSLRLFQHVEMIQAPTSWKLTESHSWKDVTWEIKRFEVAPGNITTLIQKEIMEEVGFETYAIS